MKNSEDDEIKNPRELALIQMLNGNHKSSVSLYQSLLEHNPKDKCLLMELACALAAASRADEAREILNREVIEALLPNQKARHLTAEAFSLLRENPSSDVGELLAQATILDPSFTLPHLSLGRIWLWSKKNPNKARHHIMVAEQLHPQSLGILLNRIALEVEAENYLEACRHAIRTLRMHIGSIKAWLVAVLVSIIVTPKQGGVVGFLLSLTTFIPRVGPILYLVWIIVTIITVIYLRRLSPRFVVLPLIYLLIVSLIFVARFILLGSIFP